MDAFYDGQVSRVQEPQSGSLISLPGLPTLDAQSTATWIKAVLAGQEPIPAPIALQVAHIVRLSQQKRTTP
jgi:anthranilate phosphoribosyltransferase